jgi:hypothetical protein
MGAKEIIVAIVLPILVYMGILTLNRIKVLDDNQKISNSTKHILYYTTVICPVLGYYIVRRIQTAKF